MHFRNGEELPTVEARAQYEHIESLEHHSLSELLELSFETISERAKRRKEEVLSKGRMTSEGLPIYVVPPEYREDLEGFNVPEEAIICSPMAYFTMDGDRYYRITYPEIFSSRQIIQQESECGRGGNGIIEWVETTESHLENLISNLTVA